MGREEEEKRVWEEDLSEEDRDPRHKRTSLRDVVGDETTSRLCSGASSSRLMGSPRERAQEPLTIKKSPQRLYTQDEVQALLTERNYRRRHAAEKGWSPVISKATRKKATAQAREQMGITNKKRKASSCWECGESDHLSADCPQGMTCLYCHRKGHLIADCPRNEPKAKSRKTAVHGDRRGRGEYSSSGEEKAKPKIFTPFSEEMLSARAELQKKVGVIFKTSGNPSLEDMIEGLKATSICLSEFKWRPFLNGKDTLL